MSEIIIAPDGLPASEVGPWAPEKHARIRKYIDISRAVRRKFLNEFSRDATYIDLYCNYGLSRIRGTEQFVDGSAIVAYDSAAASGTGFSKIYLNDTDVAASDAIKERFARKGVIVEPTTLTAEAAAEKIVSELDPQGLHFAFLDPYNLVSLPFSIIETLASVKRMDIMIHVSKMELIRNLASYRAKEDSPLCKFAPGWKDAVDARENIDHQRRQVLAFWLDLIRNAGTQAAEGFELVTGPKNQGLYWLVFVAQSELARTFWEEIRNVNRQTEMF